MIRDPFYRQIIARLEKRGLDPELFEQCAADLLRAWYPTLVPIPGGADSGMDGALADGKGEPFPLISTTSENVIGNLTRNLKSYLKEGKTRRKVVLATSQHLTPRRINNLYKRASELGFTLVGVCTQEGIANLLYRSPEWCLELLNLTGDPPALSVVPLSERPLLTHTLVGREADFLWLWQEGGDRLLVGQPGSGKTFLLRKFALKGGGLFVVSEDRGKIAVAIRAEQPEVLIVDDAQLFSKLLKDLRQIRETTGKGFSILASCWPSEKGAIKQKLALPESRVHNLQLLTRDEIVEVIKATGIHGPIQLIRELVDQAEGRPGLAVTLAHLCLLGGVQEVALGDALSRDILSAFEPIVGQLTGEILAAFSIGGDSGMPVKIVAEELNLRLIEVRNAVTKLDANGVISDVGRQSLSVRPPALRHSLVRDVFFKDATSLPIEGLLTRVPYLPHAARTLIGAEARGASVPQGLLRGVLEHVHSGDVWAEYAWLGREETSWVLKHHPEKLITIARPALHQAPKSTIPLLLEAAIGDRRPLHSTTDQPLRLIQDWINAGRPGTGQMFERRDILCRIAKAWLSSGRDVDVGLRAFQFVLSPKFEYRSIDPGVGKKWTIHFGYPSMDEIHSIQSLWPEIMNVLRTIIVANWEPICRMIESWAYPGRLNVQLPSEQYSIIRSFAGQLLRDTVSLAKNRPGFLHWASQIAEHLAAEAEIPLNPVFETLYPVENLRDWEKTQEDQRLSVSELARKWSKLESVEVVEKIVWVEEEARSASIEWPRWTPFLCEQIAQRVESPSAWIRAMVDADSTSDLVAPFLRSAAEVGESGWAKLAAVCLGRPALRGAVVSIVLTLDAPPQDLLAGVLQELDGYTQLVRILCLRKQVSESIVRLLLLHEDETIAQAAAYGEWGAEPDGTVRDSLREDWRNVVLNRVDDDHWLGRVLKGDPSLAHDWLRILVGEQYPSLYRYENALKAAVGALDDDGRLRILQQVSEAADVAELIAHLIDDDLGLYQVLLNDDRLRRFHLVPLSGCPEGIWVEKATLAMDYGYDVEEIARAAYTPYESIVMWSGNESDRWASWIERFDHLCSHEDERIRKIGAIGKANVQTAQERALAEERKEAVFGIR